MAKPPGFKHVIIKPVTHSQLKQFKESEGGRNIPEILEDIVGEAYQRRFFSQRRKQAAYSNANKGVANV
jgi:hypothetical protein